MSERTVVALSTPPGESAIAVVRMSGEEAPIILARMAPEAEAWESHTTHKAIIKDSAGETVDEVLAVIMRKPDSYTGENVVEISCHGSVQVVTAVIERALELGAELAGPGEFTKRAFLNGKMDLAQAEAVADLISSETRLQSRVALEHLRGGLSERIRIMERKLLEQLSLVEVSIDFSQEEIEPYSPEKLAGVAGEIEAGMRDLIDSGIPGRKLRQGIRVTLSGPRNAGKSSIYNTLLGEERAIVSHIPGTTRDILRERIHIKGFTYFLEDTAGLGDTGCEVEAKGISAGMRAAGAADMVIFVLDGSRKPPRQEIERARNIQIERHVIVLNKKDLGLRISGEKAAELIGAGRVIEVSAVTGEGLDKLKEWIYQNTVSPGVSRVMSERIAVNSRQREALARAKDALARMENAIFEGEGAEILAVELREAINECGKITGRSVEDDLLDNIFKNFCIGK